MSMDKTPLHLEDYYTPRQFGERIGVTRQRVMKLLEKTDEFPEGRIVGVRHVKLGDINYTLIPRDARILRPIDRTREGKVSEYIDDWERHHGLLPKQSEPEVKDSEAWRKYMEGFFVYEEQEDETAR